MDFSSFLAQDQEEEEDDVVESTVVPTHPEILKIKIKRTRNDSLLSDTQSIHSDISVMKELPSSQSQVVPEKKEKRRSLKKLQRKRKK